jgi:hypothetical protein
MTAARQARRAANAKEAPMFVVTGIARSGTSYVCRLLGALPGVFCAHEPMTDFMLSVSDRSDFGRVFYADRAEGFCVRQLYAKGVDPARISRLGMKIPFPDLSLTHVLQLPDLIVVAMLRHPVDLFLSQHKRDLDGSPWPREVFQRDGGLYKYHIYNNFCHLLDNLNPARLLRVKYEELAREPEALGRVAAFIGLDPVPAPEVCAAVASEAAGFGRRPEGLICPRRGCPDNRTAYPPHLVAYFTELAARCCPEAMARLGYAV